MSGTQREPLLSAAPQGEQQVALHMEGQSPAPPAHSNRKYEGQASPASRGLTTFIGVLGALITAGAVVLHFSGLEPVDLSFQDDKCFSGPNITVNGLPVDACLTRKSVEQGTECGKAAADAFCEQLGGNYHVNFTLQQDVADKVGTITLGNHFIGGKLGFKEVCCDVGIYTPAWSRILLLVGGIGLLYWVSALAARLLLWLLEMLSAWLQLDAGEVLYFLLGMESPSSWVLFSASLLWWIEYTLWVVWCENGVDCESHGSPVRQQLYNVAQVILLFAVGSFFAKAAPRIISMHYLYAGQFARVRDTMRKETLLAALTGSEVSEIVRARKQQERQLAVSGSSTVPHADSGSGSLHKRNKRRGNKSFKDTAGHRDLRGLLETVGLGGGSSVNRFRNFLNHYSNASEDDLAEEAAAEGEVLFDNLVGQWDLNDDGAVGLQDFEELFRRVHPPPGFSSAHEASREAWAMFDLNMDGRLGREEVIHALAAIYHDRANTARTVISNESAVRSLEAAIGFVLYTLLLFAASNILGLSPPGSESQSSLDFFTTYVLALSFIFGDTVRSVFRSTLYLFAEQPFSVGDYLEIEDELWCVESFDLIYTQLRKWEFNQYCKVPNDMLIDSKLVNVSRGGAFKDTVPLSAPLSMSMESLKQLKELLVAAGDAKPKDIVAGSPHVKVDSIDDAQVMNLMVEWVYNFPPGDRQRVDDIREYMVAKTKEALVEVGVVEEELNLGFRLASKPGSKSKTA